MAGATRANLDFTNVKDDGGRFNKKRMPEGGYKGKITKCEDAKSKKTNASMWLYTIEVKVNNITGTYPYYCILTPESLWKTRQLFAACGIVVPKKKVALDPNKIVGRTIGVELQDTEYDGKMQSEIGATMPASEITDDTVPDTDDEDDEEETEEVEEEETEEEEEEEEEEEPEPTPPPRKRAAKKAAAPAPRATTAKKKPRAATEDDLEELDLDELE